MKVLIVFVSSHGTTEKAAHLLSDNLEGDIEILDLRVQPHPVLSPYDTIIIGASIHAGEISRKEKKFIARNLDVLATKHIGLFLCCIRENEMAVEQFERAFPKELRDIALSSGLFGGELITSKMNFFEKKIIKTVMGTTDDVSKLDLDVIKEFANQMNKYVACKV
ncbi:flavodoxin domain-containing protein [Schinkia sp. CFF1]